MDGPGPNEKVVKVQQATGVWEEVVTSSASVFDGRLLETAHIMTKDGQSLVELPRESASGKWRLWVKDIDARL